MGRSSKFLEDTSKAARESGGFNKLKDFLGIGNNNDEDEKEKKRKELIEKERQRTKESLKNRPY